jgi:nucleotide-binding universal stress UspA family protein
MRAPQKILVPVDGSECASAALEYAYALAGALHASVDIIYAYEMPPMLAPDLSILGPGGTHQTVEAWMSRDARGELEKVLAKSPSPPGVSTRNQTIAGAPRSAILAYAESNACDLIIMGTHGRNGLNRFMMGSVAEAVLRKSPVPVLTVRS